MLKRIKYISRFSEGMNQSEIEAIGLQAAERNAGLGITGVLMTGGGLFFQLLEGPPEAVDQVWASIRSDPRHRDVVLIAAQEGVTSRIFPDWAMRRVSLDHGGNAHLETLRAILPVVYEQRRHCDELVGALERAVWQELGSRSE